MKLIVEERGKQVTYEIGPEEPVVVGRGLENVVPIRDTNASRTHCRVVVEGGGARLEDLGSKNGTLLNGKKVKEPAVLKPGDRIEVGDVKIWFEERPAGEPAPPKPAATPAPAKEAAGDDDLDLDVDGTSDAILSRAAAAAGAESAAPAGPSGSSGERAAAGPSEAPKGRYSLEALEGELAGKRIAIDAFPWKFGRTKKNQVIVLEGGVSGEHAEIVSRGDGCALVDLGSTNGTKVNAAKVKRAVLTDGSRISIGTSVFVFHDASKPAPETEAGKQHPSQVVLAKQGGSGRLPAAKAQAKVPAPSQAKAAPPAKAPAAKPVAAAPAAKPAPAKPATTSPSGRAGKPRIAPEEAEKDPLADSDDDMEALEAAEPLPRSEEAEEPEEEPAEAPPGGALEGALGAAADTLGKSATMAAIESGSGARAVGAIAVGLVAVGVLVAAGIFARTALKPEKESPADLDPAPRGNRIANWSFEDDPAAGGGVAKWTASEGTLALDLAKPAGGIRSAKLTPRGGALAEARSATEVPASGRDLQLRCLIRGGPAVAAIVWESASDPGLRLVSTSDIVDAAEWTDVQATFRAPAGADRARVAILASGETGIDRVAVAEKEASTGRAAATRVAAPGLAARLDDRGLFELARDERPIFDRSGLVLEGQGPLAPLARQDAANKVIVLKSKSDMKKRDPRAAQEQPRTPRASGSIIRPDGSGRVTFVEEVDPREGGVEVHYTLSEAVPLVAPAIALYMEQASRAGKIELTLEGGKDGGKLAPPFEKSGVTEIAFGAGLDSVSLRLERPLALRAAPMGRGLVLTLSAPPGEKEVGLAFSKGSAREFDAARALFDEAEEAKKAGKLEEARRVYARIQRDFAQYAAERERAKLLEAAIVARADTALAEAAAIEGDIAALGAAGLLESASARCKFVLSAFPETTYAARAEELERRVEEKRVKFVGTARSERARELIKSGRRHLEGGRYRLAQLYLGEVVARYGDLKELADDAGRELELAKRQLGGS